MNEAVRQVLKRLHYPIEVMLVCVRWYAAYPLSLRQIEEMMAERGVVVDHATVHRWSIKILPVLAALFRRRLRPVRMSWRMDEPRSKSAASGSTCTEPSTVPVPRSTLCFGLTETSLLSIVIFSGRPCPKETATVFWANDRSPFGS